MSLLLIAAALIDWVGLGEPVDAIAILAIVVLNAVIGFVQEGKAAGALEALHSMEPRRTIVVRDGAKREIDVADVVPGDLVALRAGDRVPADMRLVESSALEVDESVLTGESLAVAKESGSRVPDDAPLADQAGKAFFGTIVTRGSGQGIVVETGASSALGEIASQLGGAQATTPLQRQLRGLTARLGTICVVIAAGAFGLTLARMGLTSEGLERAFLSSVALAVAAVPEGLATVVTVALALGVRRMAERGAVVRRLPAVETLGSATVILTDKTGTLTENRMRLGQVLVGDGPVGSLSELPPAVANVANEVIALCSDATLEPATGDPLEIALLEAVGSRTVDEFRKIQPRAGGIPFDAERRRMTTLHLGRSHPLLVVKGAPETVVPRCTGAIMPTGETALIDERARSKLLAVADRMASQGMRTLALARRSLRQIPEELADEERELLLVAVLGLSDPVRAEAADAVREAASAGVRILMVTGDHAGTATAVADRLGLPSAGTRAVTGAELRSGGIPEDPLDVSVYARVDPSEKLALVQSLQERGQIVAVTGDGVNDAPALKRADIGVAMGRSGSDVAREAADMVITDDNLATIVHAVREGRGIFENIRKVVDYLVGGNLSEISVFVGCLILFPALGVPLLPLQLLWVNLLTDGLPALALGVDRPDPTLMRRPPRRRGEALLGGAAIRLLLGRALLIATSAIAALAVARFVLDRPWSEARSVMFSVLVVAHLLYAFAVRGPDRGRRRPSPRDLVSNPWLLVGIGLGLVLQVAIVIVPAARSIFGTAALGPAGWALVAVCSFVPFAVMMMIGRHGRGEA